MKKRRSRFAPNILPEKNSMQKEKLLMSPLKKRKRKNTKRFVKKFKFMVNMRKNMKKNARRFQR